MNGVLFDKTQATLLQFPGGLGGRYTIPNSVTSLANPVWIPVSTNTLTGGTSHVSDPQWTNYPQRFYRLQMP